MIEINLLPEELKTKTAAKKINLEPKHILYFVPVIFGILVIAHIYLALINIKNSYQLRALNNQWQKLAPQRQILETAKQEYDVLSADAAVIRQLANLRINWAEKLNKLSLNLPPGIWFSEISLTDKNFILKGSVVSLQKEEMGLINRLLNNLKNDAGFFRDFTNLDLSSAQRRVIGGYDTVDFIITGTLK